MVYKIAVKINMFAYNYFKKRFQKEIKRVDAITSYVYVLEDIKELLLRDFEKDFEKRVGKLKDSKLFFIAEFNEELFEEICEVSKINFETLMKYPIETAARLDRLITSLETFCYFAHQTEEKFKRKKYIKSELIDWLTAEEKERFELIDQKTKNIKLQKWKQCFAFCFLSACAFGASVCALALYGLFKIII